MAKCMLCKIEMPGDYNICPACADLKEKAKCPQCGRRVFIPLKGWRNNYDFEVMCSDMGHWVGKLSECFPQEVKIESNWHDDWM
jgi:hypothetical protein